MDKAATPGAAGVHVATTGTAAFRAARPRRAASRAQRRHAVHGSACSVLPGASGGAPGAASQARQTSALARRTVPTAGASAAAARRGAAARDVSCGAARGGGASAGGRGAAYDSGSESGYESDCAAAGTVGLTASEVLELHGVAFPTAGFSSKNVKRSVRVWAAHVGATGEWADLCVVDPSPRAPVSWRRWSATKWQAAAQALGFPLDDDGSRCVRVRGLGTGGGKVHFHLVWGRGAPLAAAKDQQQQQQQQQPQPQQQAFVYLYISGDVNRYAPLAKLPELCGPAGTLASVSGRLSLDKREVMRMLLDQLAAHHQLRAMAAEVLGLPAGSTPHDVALALDPSLGPPPLQAQQMQATAPAAEVPSWKSASPPPLSSPPPTTTLGAPLQQQARVPKQLQQQAAPGGDTKASAWAGVDAAAGGDDDGDNEEEDGDDEDDDDEEDGGGAAVPELLQDVPFIGAGGEPGGPRGAGAAGVVGGGAVLDPASVPFGGLTSVQLYVEKGCAFAFLPPGERVDLVVARAQASGHVISAQQARTWSRGQWDRLAESLGLVFLGPAWFAPLRSAGVAGLHAGWVPDRRAFTLYIAVPALGGTRFFTLQALRTLLLLRGSSAGGGGGGGQAPPVGLPTWNGLLAALAAEGRAHAGLAACVRADLRTMEQALRRANPAATVAQDGSGDDGGAWLAQPPGAAHTPSQQLGGGGADARAAAARSTAPAKQPPRSMAPPSLPLSSAAEPPLVPPPEGTLPGKSPVELYLTLGLGFAFMKLGPADAKRIARSAASQQQAPGAAGPGVAGTWDGDDGTAAGEAAAASGDQAAPPQQQLQWLPDASHSQVLPALGRGVRAAWGAGRVYIYVPSPVDRFLQTPEIRAGFCDDVLRPASLARGAPFSAWARVVDALADAAAGNPHLHAALAADSVFPSQLLPPPEEGDLLVDDDDDTQQQQQQQQQSTAAAAAAAVGEMAQAAQTSAGEWPPLSDAATRLQGVSGELLLDDEDDDALFAHAQQQRPTTNFAPGGLTMPRSEMVEQPWREEDYQDVVLQRNAAAAAAAATAQAAALGEPGAARVPVLPELEARGVVLNDTDWGVLSLHSFDLFVRLTPDGLVDLREAYGVDKEGTLDGVSDDWTYTDRWWHASRGVPADTPPADYLPVDWARQPTLDTPRGDRRRGEETFLQSWAEERKRVYLIHNGDDLSVGIPDRKLDFRTVFCVDDATGQVTRMPVVGLLRRKQAASAGARPMAVAAAAGADASSGGGGGGGGSSVELVPAPSVGAFERPTGAALADWEETWDLPADAHLCFSWDCAYVATPDQMEDTETLAFEWLKRNRYKLRSDGTMTGTPLRLDLRPDEVARLRQEEAEEEARRWDGSVADAAAVQAAQEEAQAREEALKELEREALAEELDLPEVDS